MARPPAKHGSRLELEYAPLLTPTEEFNRKLVSYQANRQAKLHSWLKYKEAFSAPLVEKLLGQFRVFPGQKILDPFAGSGTTLLVAKELGIDAVGIEILPVCHLAGRPKSRYGEYDLAELRRVMRWMQETIPGASNRPFPHITITESAFTPEQESKLMWYEEQLAAMAVSDTTKLLLQLVLMSILEDISFTRKDGQYLRWDSRSTKAQDRDTHRKVQGKQPFKAFNKGRVFDIQEALLSALGEVIRDIEAMQQNGEPPSTQELVEGSVLQVLPQLAGAQFNAVVTSPPYCNRYDYTRTYALELAFLGAGEEQVKNLRQTLLSCTVENRSKLQQLKEMYLSIGRPVDFETIENVVNTNPALQEVMAAIRTRGDRGELNNQGVIRMVERLLYRTGLCDLRIVPGLPSWCARRHCQRQRALWGRDHPGRS